MARMHRLFSLELPFTALAEAQTETIENALSTATDEAMQLGVFGAPSFVVNGEVFWGDDRLEDAILWSKEC